MDTAVADTAAVGAEAADMAAVGAEAAPEGAAAVRVTVMAAAAAAVKGFGWRPIGTMRLALGPASESLQGRKPR